MGSTMRMQINACTDPESFVRGGPTLTFNSVDNGSPNIVPPAKSFDGGPKMALNAGLVALCFSMG